MPYLIAEPELLVKQPLVGTGQCVDLIKMLVPGLKGRPTASWCAGENVLNARVRIERGTAIATFQKGRYPNQAHGNHAAIVLSVISTGIWVIDQWKSDPQRQFVDRRFIRVPPAGARQRADGTFIRPSDNAMAFSVIELC
jgi:hypothetical protein